jgi:hypothetical protein
MSLEALSTIGRIGYDLSCLTLFIRSYDLSLKYGVEPYYNLSLIQSTIDDLTIRKNNLDSISEELKFCPEAKIIKNDLIHEYSLPDLKTFKKKNLINLLTTTLQNVRFN